MFDPSHSDSPFLSPYYLQSFFPLETMPCFTPYLALQTLQRLSQSPSESQLPGYLGLIIKMCACSYHSNIECFTGPTAHTDFRCFQSVFLSYFQSNKISRPRKTIKISLNTHTYIHTHTQTHMHACTHTHTLSLSLTVTVRHRHTSTKPHTNRKFTLLLSPRQTFSSHNIACPARCTKKQTLLCSEKTALSDLPHQAHTVLHR